MSDEIKSLIVKFGAETSRLEAAIDKVEGKTKKLGGSFGNLGAWANQSGKALLQFGAILGGAVVYGFISAAKAFEKFDTGMREVGTLSNFTAGQMDDMRASTIELSRQFGQATDVMTKARYGAISKGFLDVADQNKILAGASKLATAGVTDVNTAMLATTSVLTAYGLGVGDVNRVNDIFMKAVQSGSLKVADLSSEMGKMAPIAKVAGVSIEEMTGSLATLTVGGIAPAEAATYLRGAFLALSAPTKQAAAAMKEAGIRTTDLHGKMLPLTDVVKQFVGMNLAQIKELVPDAGAAVAIAALAENYANLTANVEAMNGAAGTTEQAFKKMQEGMGFQMARLTQQYETFKLKIFEGSDAGKDMAGAFTNLNKFLDANKGKVDAAAAAIGEMASNAINSLLIPALDMAMDSTIQWNQLLASNKQGTSNLRTEMGMFWDEMLSGTDAYSKAIQDAIAIANLRQTTEKSMADAIVAEHERTGLSIKELADVNSAAHKQMVDSIAKTSGEAIPKLAEAFAKAAPQITASFGNMVKGLGDKAKSMASSMYSAGTSFIGQLIAGMVARAEALYAKVSAIAAKVRGYFGHSPAKWGPLVDLQMGGASIVEQLAIGMAQGAHKLTDVTNAVAQDVKTNLLAGATPTVPLADRQAAMEGKGGAATNGTGGQDSGGLAAMFSGQSAESILKNTQALTEYNKQLAELKTSATAMLEGGIADAWGSMFEAMASGQESGGKALLKGLGKTFGSVLAMYGKFLMMKGMGVIAESIYPPNPAGLVAGGIQLAKGGALMAAAGLLKGAKFHQGGVVGGSAYAPPRDVPIIAQAGERVLSRRETQAMERGDNGGGQPIVIHVDIDGDTIAKHVYSRRPSLRHI